MESNSGPMGWGPWWIRRCPHARPRRLSTSRRQWHNWWELGAQAREEIHTIEICRRREHTLNNSEEKISIRFRVKSLSLYLGFVMYTLFLIRPSKVCPKLNRFYYFILFWNCFMTTTLIILDSGSDQIFKVQITCFDEELCKVQWFERWRPLDGI